MTYAERFSGAVVSYSKVVVVATLLATAVLGVGVGALDDDSSLDQFEGDSPEAAAAEYASSNFSAADSENTTTAQLIVRGDDVLTRASLRQSLEVQREIRANESINRTLADENAMFGVENLIVRRAMIEDRADELEAEGDELQAEFDRLNETRDELNQSAQNLQARGNRTQEAGEELRARGRALRQRGERLQADRARLENRTGILQTALEETAGLQREYEQADSDQERAAINDSIESTWTDAEQSAGLDAEQNATFEQAGQQVREVTSLEVERGGTIQQGPAQITNDTDEQAILREALNETIPLQREYLAAESDAERAEINDTIETTWSDAATNASLDSSQEQEFYALGGDVRDLTTEIQTVGPIEAAFQAGTRGVFADEWADIQQRGQALQEEREELETRAGRLEVRGERLQEERERLEDRGEELENRYEELQDRAEELENRSEELRELDPTIEEQLDYLASMNDSELETAIDDTLGDEDNDRALGLMASSYEPGSSSADARMTIVRQQADAGGGPGGMGGVDQSVVDAQLGLQDLLDRQDHDHDYVLFGVGAMSDEIERSMGDSLAIVGPLALVFVVIALAVAYRDVLDIALGVLGILVVLVWTLGFMGWAGIAFNQMFVAIPVLLIGLSIDYAIHVFMRHREQRGSAGAGEGVGGSMRIALAGVGVALVWVTATAAIGFLANLVSPIGPIREFGVVSAVGIVTALIVFGTFVPAVKVEVDEWLEGRGVDRDKRAFGTGDSPFSRALTVGAAAARRAPVVVLLLVLVLTAGGVYGAASVDTSFEQEDFIADSPPAWTEHLPGPMEPGEYSAKENLDYVNANFQREDSQAQLLIRGDVTHDQTLERVNATATAASESDAVYVLPSGRADVETPLSVMEDVAERNDSFNDSFTAADTDDDGVPDRNVEALYDELYEVEESAARNVIYRTDDGEYEAIRLIVSIRGDAAFDDTTREMRALAASTAGADASEVSAGTSAGGWYAGDLGADAPQWEVVATGSPIVSHIVEQDLLRTVLQSLLITLVATFVFLTVAYRLTGKGASLGTVTLLPVAVAVSWILGTMYLVGMPFNVLTGMITSLTIGLGVAYSIHVSSRYTLELERQGNVWDAMHTTVTGTGGALLGSAATTIGGFGVLAFAILPVLRQFGIITGLTIAYTFLASVVVLPTLLVLWTRYLGPDVSFDASESRLGTTAAADGGRDGSDGGSADTAAGATAEDSVAPAEYGDATESRGDDE